MDGHAPYLSINGRMTDPDNKQVKLIKLIHITCSKIKLTTTHYLR